MLSVIHCRQLPATQNRHFSGCRQNVVDFLVGQSVPRGIAPTCIVLKSLPLLSRQPPVVGPPKESEFTQDLAFGETRGRYLCQQLCLL